MDFVEKIRKKLKVRSQYGMAQLLDISPQTYRSLTLSNDRIRLKELVRLRELAAEIGWNEKKLFDEIEKEYQRRSKNE